MVQNPGGDEPASWAGKNNPMYTPLVAGVSWCIYSLKHFGGVCVAATGPRTEEGKTGHVGQGYWTKKALIWGWMLVHSNHIPPASFTHTFWVYFWSNAVHVHGA